LFFGFFPFFFFWRGGGGGGPPQTLASVAQAEHLAIYAGFGPS